MAKKFEILRIRKRYAMFELGSQQNFDLKTNLENFTSNKPTTDDGKILLSFVSNCHFADSYRQKLLETLKSALGPKMSYKGKCGSDTFYLSRFFRSKSDDDDLFTGCN